jgi:HAE1 family hydrophobic/amphiphilic exporter-1
VLFLRDPRYPIAIALAIPISVVTAFGLFHLAGVSINIMSLGGLALGTGMLVDNSIVVIENIFRHREKGLAAAAAAALGTEEVQRAITAATLTTIAVFGPIVYVEGVAGEMFASLSFAVAFSLIASLLVAVTLLPTMAARWSNAESDRVRSPGPIARLFRRPLAAFDRSWERFALFYQAVLGSALVHRRRVVLASVVLLALSIPIAFQLPRSVLPEVDQGEFRARMELERGTPLDQTAQRATQLEQLIREDDAVDVVFSRIGRQAAVVGMDEEHSGLNTALLEVRLHPGHRTNDVLDRLRPKLAALPAGAVTLETGHATALGKLLGAGEADLAVRVRGENMDSAMAYAGLVSRRLRDVPAVTNVRVGVELGQPEYIVEIDRERAAAFGIDPASVVTVIENAMRGRASANPFVAFDRKIPIMVRLPEDDRRSLETLDLLTVQNVPVRQLITVREAVGPVEIQRLDQGRVIPVYADAADNDVEAAVSAVEAALAGAPPPHPMRYEIGGENEEMRRSFRELTFAFLLALLLVYMILAAEFESLVQPFTILLSVPLGLIGAILALWLFGAGLNTVSLIGIVILVGIVDNNAVVMLDFINQRKDEGAAVREAILDAGRARLRPILMTTITTMLAIMPMMLGIGAGAGLQAPLAIAVFGGLFSATALTLLVIPVVYEMIDDFQAWVRGREPAARRVSVRPAPAESLLEHDLAGSGRAGGD